MKSFDMLFSLRIHRNLLKFNINIYLFISAVATGEFIEGLKCISIKEGESVELSCETRHFDAEVRWLLNEQEIVNGAHCSIKRIGYTRRLHITSPGQMDGTIKVATTNESCTVSLKGNVQDSWYTLFRVQ